MGFPEFNNFNRVYIVATLTEVVSVITIPKTEESSLQIDKDEYTPFMIWEFFGPENEVMQVGEKIKNQMSHYRLLKQMGPIPYSPRNFSVGEFKKHEEERKKLFNQFAQNFNKELLQKVKEQYSKSSQDDEVIYRCFYNSFKMYRCRDYVIEMAQLLISLAEQKKYESETNEELLSKFEELKFDLVLIKLLKETLGCTFALNRNDPQAWSDDSKTLFASYTLFKGALDYFIRFCEHIVNQTAFFQQQNHRCLSWEEAGAMEVWAGISFLRSAGDEAHKKYAEMIKIK